MEQTEPRRSVVRRRLRPLLVGLALAAAALVGGVVATIVSPTTVSIRYYEADVSLSPDPRDSGTIRAGTIVGDLGAEFSGLAPGVVIEPRVTREITDLLRERGVDTAALTPTPQERSEAIGEAATGVATRFGIGALLGVLGLLSAPALWRHGWPRRRSLVAGAVAWSVVTAGVLAGTWRTYRPERMVAIHSSGLLEVATENRALLEDVEARADQASPYLRNVLALSDALTQEYSPTELDTPAALRVLLVSDVHAANQYPLMRTIVEQQQIDLVIDSGDLINLGVVQEAELSRLYAGIESLGVPYVFVRGNHDSTSPGPGRLVEKLASVDNVILLEPDERTFREVDAGGLRISGFNDPRYYGDPDPDPEESQAPARERYLASVAEREPPDIAVSHQATALRDVPGLLRVHGHGHVPLLDGSTVQVGTFTGGGTLSHFVSGPDAELTGQANSFDVLSYGEDCRLLSMHRYQYRQILEGRPSYDSVAVLNGSGVAEPPEEGRACDGDRAVTSTDFPVVEAEPD